MTIETRFSIGERVYQIARECPQEWVMCPACGGDKRVILKDGKDRMCPECYGSGGKYAYKPQEWLVAGTLTIGLVDVRVCNIKKTGIFDNVGVMGDPQDTEREVKYMAYETGIKSGTLWPEENLFPTEVDALVECEKRNASKEKP